MPLSIWSSVLNYGIGLVYAGLGIAIITQKISSERTLFPLHQWLVVFVQGFTMAILGTFGFRKQHNPHVIALKLLSALFVIYVAFISISSSWEVISYNKTSLKSVLDIITLPGAVLFFLCVLVEHKHAKLKQTSTRPQPYIHLCKVKGLVLEVTSVRMKMLLLSVVQEF
ncbi:hypothetical protein POM88_043774 [Heracleum sosnowskyi]|uniref:ABCC10-like N-terminal domain-containing protein n=1 Tax=Heracleum sosnowskyi TaxID=360622 RepID=A0AAD8H1M5_9APIA|nr:hypothetical protein POM88_043774 [Heracleum sosnowskyi]